MSNAMSSGSSSSVLNTASTSQQKTSHDVKGYLKWEHASASSVQSALSMGVLFCKDHAVCIALTCRPFLGHQRQAGGPQDICTEEGVQTVRRCRHNIVTSWQ